MEKFANTKVLILAAGFGKRLKPLTDTIPKPLITAGNRTILALILEKVLKIGFNQSQIVINTHYLAEKISNFVMQNYPKVKWQTGYDNPKYQTIDGVLGIVHMNIEILRSKMLTNQNTNKIAAEGSQVLTANEEE